MSHTTTPIQVGDRMPDSGFLRSGRRRNFYEQVVLSPEPAETIVVQFGPWRAVDTALRPLESVSFDNWNEVISEDYPTQVTRDAEPGPDGATDPNEVPTGKKPRREKATRYYKVSTSPRIIHRTLDVPSADEHTEFSATVIAVYSVRDAIRVVKEHRDRDPVEALRAEIESVVQRVARGYGIEEATTAEDAIERELARDLNIPFTIDRCWIMLQPDPASAERAKAINAARLEEQLQNEEAKHEQDLFEKRKDFDERRSQQELSLERARVEHQRTLERARVEHEQELEKVRIGHEQELEEIRIDNEKKLELARVDHEKKLDALRHELDTERAKHQRKLAEMEREQADASADAVAARERKAVRLINDDIAQRPDNIVGYLLALDDTKQAREAIKLMEDRQRTQLEQRKELERSRWERLKEIGKLEMFREDEELRRFALAQLGKDVPDAAPPENAAAGHDADHDADEDESENQADHGDPGTPETSHREDDANTDRADTS